MKENYDGVDVLINNAGTNLDAKYGPETTKKTLDVNFRGTLKVWSCRLVLVVVSMDSC